MKVAVLGAGLMGSGIAAAFALKKHNVKVWDFEGKEIAKKNVEKQILNACKKDETLSKTFYPMAVYMDSFEELKDCDLIIEAIIEKMPLKIALFKKVEPYCSPSAILATNTSSLSVSELAKNLKNPERFLGLHFFNPPTLMKLVEIIQHNNLSNEVLNKAVQMMQAIDKTHVIVKDKSGFVVNRLLVPMINEASKILQEKIASREDIDTAMKLGASHPIGPLALGDLIGLDVCLFIMNVLHENLGEQFKPSSLLEKLVEEKKLGRKTKSGFYNYE